MRRGLLKGTIEEILARAQAHLLRELVIGTPEDVHKPVLLHLTKDATYYDSGLRAPSSKNIRDTMNDLGEIAGCLTKLGGHTLHRGAARDMNNLKDGQCSIETNNAVASMLGHNGSGGVGGQTNKYADARIEDFGRGYESLLPPVMPLTDSLAFQPQQENTLRMTDWPLPGVSLDAKVDS
jgi:hypothetical protein